MDLGNKIMTIKIEVEKIYSQDFTYLLTVVKATFRKAKPIVKLKKRLAKWLYLIYISTRQYKI